MDFSLFLLASPDCCFFIVNVVATNVSAGAWCSWQSKKYLSAMAVGVALMLKITAIFRKQ